MASDKPSLETWVERVSTQEMPIFGHTVQEVVTVSENDRAPASELAKVVLQDASMTARTLKLANTPFYNPRERGISTVSRAVVVLGFNTVRNMCLSLALVDAFVSGAPRERMTRELARSIHAAVQARALSEQRGDDSPEEVFIATLLYRLGDLAFWCFSGETGDQLDSLQQQPGYSPEKAEQEVLGFRLRHLTGALVKEWRLNELLNETLASPERAGDRGRTILLTHKLATAAEKGWDSPETQEAVQQLAKLMKMPEADLRKQLHGNAREAARVAGLYGASMAGRVIPQPGPVAAAVPTEETITISPYPAPDGMLQLRILRELSSLLEGKPDANLIMESVLEGIYRGVGMDRTLFALMTPDRRTIRAKFMLGGGPKDLTQRFHFPVGSPPDNAFAYVLERSQALWVDLRQHPEYQPLVPPMVSAVIGKLPFYVAPIVVNGRSIGLFYADRALSGRLLDEESFESFKHFVHQAGLGLTHLTRRR